MRFFSFHIKRLSLLKFNKIEYMKEEIAIHYHHFKNESELSEIEKKLFNKAKEIRLKAYAPYSNFLVGCAVLLENGEIVVGNNQENAAYPSGTCAERTAIYWASANFPNEKIEKLFIVGGPKIAKAILPPVPPCGSCRQSILEYESKQNNHIEVYFGNLMGEVFKVESMKALLPFSFNQEFL